MRGDHEYTLDPGQIQRRKVTHGARRYPVPESPFDARELVGLLADDDRRRAIAALILGATTIEGVQSDTGLTARAAGRSVQRLVDAGLVVRSDDGTLHLLGEAFGLAARAEAERAPRSPEHDAEPENVARVLRA